MMILCTHDHPLRRHRRCRRHLAPHRPDDVQYLWSTLLADVQNSHCVLSAVRCVGTGVRNERFLQFVKEVEDKLSKDPTQSANKIEFDIPYKELGFTGVPAKQQVQIMPTVHSLVALDDNPPMVVNLNEVEIACMERIQFGLKNFDLVFVWKDFKKLPMRIEAIPIKSFEPIKHWLNSCDIVFYESSQNILWKTVMKQVPTHRDTRTCTHTHTRLL